MTTDASLRLRKRFRGLSVMFFLMCASGVLCWELQSFHVVAFSMTPANFTAALEGAGIGVAGYAFSFLVEKAIATYRGD